MVLPIMGLCYRKKYWDSAEQRLVTTTVLPQDLVVPYRTKSLSKTPRKTEICELYDREIKEYQNLGIYRKVELGAPELISPDEADERDGISSDLDDKSRPRRILEQHLFLDLDGDGYEEPYIATVDQSSRKVLRLVQRFGKVVSKQSQQADQLKDRIYIMERQKEDITAQARQIIMSVPADEPPTPEMAQQLQAQTEQLEMQLQQIDQQIQQIQQAIAELEAEKPQILRIDPIECYTKYSFIPAPDGSFYDIGFGSLIGPLNRSVNSLINQLIDSGSLQNGSQGFIGRGARLKGGRISFEPYEWKQVQSTGSNLREAIVPLPVNSPSPVLFQLLGLLIEFTQQLSSVTDAMAGKDMGQNTPAYNMQMMVQQGMQVFSGIFKRVYRSMRTEFAAQYKLNSIYLNPVEYFSTVDGPIQVLQADYSGDEKDIYPAADPNAFSQVERGMKAQFLAQRAAMVPGYDSTQVELRLLRSMDIEDTQEVYPLDENGQLKIPPPKNPELEIEILDAQRRTEEGRMRSETNARRAESQIAVDEATVMKMMADMQFKGQEVELAGFDAITRRIKAQGEAVKAQREFLTKQEGSNEDSRGNSRE
jgi:hypothetical protein